MIQPTTEQLADIGREVLAMYDTSPQWWHDNLAMVVVWKIEEYRKPTHFVTFGADHEPGPTGRGHMYALIHAETEAEARRQVIERRDLAWAFIYPIEDMPGHNAKNYYLRGGEVPL